jgi:hypothetical protein
VTSEIMPSGEETPKFSVTYIGQAKHTVLLRLCRRLSRETYGGRYGGQSLLARELGVDIAAVGRWINFKGYPNYRDEVKQSRVEAKLMTMTGMDLEEIFPPELRRAIDAGFRSRVEVEREIPTSQLAVGLDQAARLSLPSPPSLDDAERTEAVEAALKVLPRRHRDVLRLYFGFDGEPNMTFKEIGRRLGVSSGYVGSLVAQGLRRLRHPRHRKLAEFAEGYEPDDG